MREKNKTKVQKYHLTKRIIMQYLITLTGFTLALIAGVFVSWFICNQVIWYYDDPVYQILHFIHNYLPWVLFWVLLVIWGLITYFFLLKPLKYIDEIVVASKRLANPDGSEIKLNKALYEVQLDMNHAREQALRNAELAKEADKRKNDMIVYLAHDLKTPLTSVIGYLSLLNDEPQISAETRAKYTGIALEKAERLEQMINEFFDITRFSLTTLSLEPERINLSLMLEQTLSEFLPVFTEKNLTANADIQPNVELLCDPDKLERVFDNLLRNAVNYSYKNTEISLKMLAENDYVTVILRNRGRTIPKEKLDKIFDQFFRVDSARQSSTGGAGLGLAIAKEIVTLHGGTITAQSESESIVFKVVLPKV